MLSTAEIAVWRLSSILDITLTFWPADIRQHRSLFLISLTACFFAKAISVAPDVSIITIFVSSGYSAGESIENRITIIIQSKSINERSAAGLPNKIFLLEDSIASCQNKVVGTKALFLFIFRKWLMASTHILIAPIVETIQIGNPLKIILTLNLSNI
jgi:hypothetical protein